MRSFKAQIIVQVNTFNFNSISLLEECCYSMFRCVICVPVQAHKTLSIPHVCKCVSKIGAIFSWLFMPSSLYIRLYSRCCGVVVHTTAAMELCCFLKRNHHNFVHFFSSPSSPPTCETTRYCKPHILVHSLHQVTTTGNA